MASKLHLETALLPDGWRHDVVVTVEHGVVAAIDDVGSGPAERISGVTVPGLPNMHSHAFQRAMAGLTEHRGSEADSFWTWREQMYRFVEQLSPDDLEAIAALAYMEMLEAGFTSVAEFHYLHHQPDGRPYDNIAEMSERIVAAADQAGIGLILLPVLYRQGGFLGKAPSDGQRRFLNTRESYARLMETRVPGGAIGIAPHSLRAVTLGDLEWAATTWRGQPAHIHIGEQTREVDDCLTAHGKRPVDLLMDAVAVDSTWFLIHATHADRGEIARMAQGAGDRRPLPDHRSQSRRRAVRRAIAAGRETAASASAPTPTCASRPPTNFARSNTASACSTAGAMCWATPRIRPAAACSTMRSAPARLRPASARTSWCWRAQASAATRCSTAGCSPPTTPP